MNAPSPWPACRCAVVLRALPVLAISGLLLVGKAVESAPDSVRISLPAAVGFAVTNVGVSTTGSPSATSVSFSGLYVPGGRVLRISVKADGDFVPPGGAAIPASKVSWSASGATNGIGSGGVLSTSAYGQLFQSAATKKSGNVNITWTLGAPGIPLRAGNHSVLVRWKLESIIP